MSNPIKPTLKTEIFPLFLLLFVAASSLYFYAHFPDQVPTHWNYRGEVDGWSSRAAGAFLIPAMLAGMYLLFLALPYLDPKRERYSQFRKVYHVFKAVIMFFLAVIYYVAGLNALGYRLPVEAAVPLMVGALFIVLGNYFGKIKPNWFMGIRTPWTLSSEEVWNNTHRYGGKAFIVGGLVMMSMPLWPDGWQLPLFIGLIVLAAVSPIVYSYILYAREKKHSNSGGDQKPR